MYNQLFSVAFFSVCFDMYVYVGFFQLITVLRICMYGLCPCACVEYDLIKVMLLLLLLLFITKLYLIFFIKTGNTSSF